MSLLNFEIKMNNILNKKFFLYVLLILGVFVLLIPFLIRSQINSYDYNYYNDVGYIHLNNYDSISKLYLETGSFELSNYVTGGLFSFYDLIVFFLSKFVVLKYVVAFLPILLGFLFLTILINLFKNLDIPRDIISLSLIVIIFSPLFLMLFTQLNQFNLLLVIMFFMFFLGSTKNTLLHFLSLLLLLPISFYGFFTFFLTIFLLLGLMLYKKRRPMIVMVSVIISIIIFLIPKLLNLSFKIINYPFELFLNEFIVDFGGRYGFGIMYFCLLIIGISFFWSKFNSGNLSSYYLKLLLLVIILLAIFYDYSIILVLFPIFSLMVSYSIVGIARRNWKILDLKMITLIIIMSALFFSFMTFSQNLCYDNPTQEEVESLKWMKIQGLEGFILSYDKYEHFVKYYSKANSMLRNESDNGFYGFNDNSFNVDLNYIFHSQNLRKTRDLLKQYNISYIWINKDMKDGLVWDELDEGLLFLLKNNETFEKIYDSNSIEIWDVKWVTRYYNLIGIINEFDLN
jgi:hypothetical protein